MNLFIVLEGADGTGKTTVGTMLAERIGGKYIRTPGEEYKPIRSRIDKEAHHDARLLFYLSSVVDASHKIEDLLTQMPIVCDRYIWSSLIPHAAYYNESLESLEAQWNPLIKKLTLPTYTVLLKVDEEEQLRRIGGRANGSLTASDQACMREAPRKRLRELYDQIALRDGWLKVDTTYQDQKSVMNEILRNCEVPVLA